MSHHPLDQAALELFRSILAVQPNHPGALHGLGLGSMQSSDWDMAIQWFDRAVAAAPASAQYHADLGHALRRAGMTDPAIAALEKALALQPDLAPATEALNAALAEKHLWDAAEAAIQSRRLVAVTLYQPGDESVFRDWHDAAVKYAKPCCTYVINRGGTPVESGDCRWINLPDDPVPASALLTDASAALLLGCFLAYHERADLLFSPENSPLAEGTLEKLYHDSKETGIATQPHLLIRHDFLLRFATRFITFWPPDAPDRMQEKLAEISKTASLSPCPAWLEPIPPDQVQQTCRQILRTDSNNVDALRRLSVYAAQTLRSDMSVRWLNHAVQASPNAADLHADLGQALRESGRLPRAIASFQRALQLDPRHSTATEKLRSAIAEQRRLDSGPDPGGRAPRFIIITGYFNNGSKSTEDFFRLWYDNTLKFAKPHRIYVINAASKPVDYGDCRWINLSQNLGHVMGGMSRRQQLGGWSTSLFLGCLLAYLERADFIYKEQDCLAFGNYVDRLYDEIGPAGFITGRTNESGSAIGLLGTALMLGKLNFLPEFIARYLSTRASDVDLLPESKIAAMAKTGRLLHTRMGYDRSRPVNLSDPAFYLQNITADEMTALKRAGLI